MRKSFLALAIVGLLVGCAAQEPLLRPTASGLAEGTFRGATLDEARSKLIGACASKGVTVHDSGPNHVVCGKEMDGAGAAVMQTLIGNSYSTTPVVKLRATIYQQGSDVRVTAQQWSESQMRMGQVNKMDLDSNRHRNELQRFLTYAGAH